MVTLNPLPALIARRRIGTDAVHFPVTEDWQQGRTCYGGLISTLAVVAMRDLAGHAWPAEASLRGLQTCFVAPVVPGEVEIGVQLLRQGRNVCQVQAQARQGGQVAAVLLGVFGADRPSSLRPHVPQRPAARREADALPARPMRTGPAFLQHFDMRWADGPPPYSGGEGCSTSIHMRLTGDEAASLSAELQTVLLADLPPTPVVGQLMQPSANSSVTWALELRPLPPGAPGGWWRADNESTMVDGGYVNHTSRLWAPDGQLAAFGSQVVAVFG
jgi:acyl-CoA thioesterase